METNSNKGNFSSDNNEEFNNRGRGNTALSGYSEAMSKGKKDELSNETIMMSSLVEKYCSEEISNAYLTEKEEIERIEREDTFSAIEAAGKLTAEDKELMGALSLCDVKPGSLTVEEAKRVLDFAEARTEEYKSLKYKYLVDAVQNMTLGVRTDRLADSRGDRDSIDYDDGYIEKAWELRNKVAEYEKGNFDENQKYDIEAAVKDYYSGKHKYAVVYPYSDEMKPQDLLEELQSCDGEELEEYVADRYMYACANFTYEDLNVIAEDAAQEYYDYSVKNTSKGTSLDRQCMPRIEGGALSGPNGEIIVPGLVLRFIREEIEPGRMLSTNLMLIEAASIGKEYIKEDIASIGVGAKEKWDKDFKQMPERLKFQNEFAEPSGPLVKSVDETIKKIMDGKEKYVDADAMSDSIISSLRYQSIYRNNGIDDAPGLVQADIRKYENATGESFSEMVMNVAVYELAKDIRMHLHKIAKYGTSLLGYSTSVLVKQYGSKMPINDKFYDQIIEESANMSDIRKESLKESGSLASLARLEQHSDMALKKLNLLKKINIPNKETVYSEEDTNTIKAIEAQRDILGIL